jgi:hypothetical protein
MAASIGFIRTARAALEKLTVVREPAEGDEAKQMASGLPGRGRTPGSDPSRYLGFAKRMVAARASETDFGLPF